MSTTILTTSFNRTTEYPEYVSISAPNCCGTVTLLLDESVTKQMCYELPAINIDIYVEVNGKKCLYMERALILHTDINRPNKTYMILDIPQNCYFAITPIFDNYALDSHNEMTKVFNANSTNWKTTYQNIPKKYVEQFGYIYPINEDNEWNEVTTEFNMTLIFDNTNIKAGGGGGSTPTPTPSDLPPVLYYGVSANSSIDSLTGLTEMNITQNEFPITFNNMDNEYQVIAYETGYNDITSIKTSTGDIELIGTFPVSTLSYSGKTYKVLISENRLTFDTISYKIKF